MILLMPASAVAVAQYQEDYFGLEDESAYMNTLGIEYGTRDNIQHRIATPGMQNHFLTPGSQFRDAAPELHRSDLITPVLLRKISSTRSSGSLRTAVRERPGYAFLSSAIIPGSAQAARGRWLRTGLYLAIEAAAIYAHVEWRNRGNRGERNYENFADQNWSVVQYANWLVDYHDQHGISNPGLQDLREMVDGTTAAFDTDIDWEVVNLNVLRSVERNTPYIVTDDMAANNFSHTLPAYGSQQYYELISKYFQYAPGWSDYYSFNQQNGNDPFLFDRFGGKASPLFWDGKDRAELFNNQFRFSNNMLSLLILNHLISAFDGYFSVQLENRRIEASAGETPGQQIRIIYRF